MIRAQWAVLYAISGDTWRVHPVRFALAVLGIALGVALGVAVHLINASALNEFNRAVRSLAGEADLVIRGPRAGFPEELYAVIARKTGVRAASPAVEMDVQVSGERRTIKVLGVDPFRAAQVEPHLLTDREGVFELLKGDAVLVSAAAANNFGLKVGSVLRLQNGTRTVPFRVAGVLPPGSTHQSVAVMDIATAQWRLERVGVLQRIDVKLEPGTSIIAFQRAIQSDITPGVVVTPPLGEAERSSSLSRAYRTNLDMLALVTLFTGAFLIFSTQFLSITRRRTQLGVLRALGLTRARLCGWIVLEGAIVGVCGSALGLVLGYLIAELGLERFGGDLGAGYFNGNQPQLSLEPTASTIFFLLGVLFATAGAALPAFEAARRAPALALKAGDEEMPLRRLGRARPGLLLMAAGFVLSQAPPLAELPIWGYLSIALVLTGAILMMPWFATFILVRLPQLRFTPAALARAQLQATPRQVGVSLAAILASFSLMVSMVLMVGSFRTSLAVWLNTMLAADLYVRAGGAGESGYFTPEEESAIQRTRGVRDAMFTRSQNIFLRADRAPFTLIARSIASGKFEPDLPFQGPTLGPTANDLPYAWVSEVAADLLGVKTGAQIELPIGKALRTFRVAGVWRDYARQNGAIVIARPLYVALTGDARTNDAALNLDAAASIGEVSQRLRNVFDHGDAVDIVSTRELKNKSLAIFDRTFAVTYALEIAAVLLGLFGVSASFSAQALARQREFGVLRHMGMTRSQISAMLGAEGLIVGGLGVAAGLTLGWIISLILIHVINRQSFHWTMEIYPPWHTLALLAGVMIIAATATAVLSARLAMSEHVTRAVREDW